MVTSDSPDVAQIIIVNNPNWSNTIIPKTLLNDRRLSWKAKGILALILCKVDEERGWTPTISNLTKHTKDGTEATRTALKELREYGYFHNIQIKEKKSGKIVKHAYLACGDADFMQSIVEKCTAPDGTLLQNQVFQILGKKFEQEYICVFINKYTNILNKSPNISDTCKEEESSIQKRGGNQKVGAGKVRRFDKDSIERSLSELLLTCIQENRPNFKFSEAQLQKWSLTFHRMLNIDKRSKEEIADVIEWCQQDDFWYQNILSADKLRKQYDRLFLQMEKQKTEPQRRVRRSGPVVTIEPSKELIQAVLDEWHLRISRDRLPERVEELKKESPEDYEHFRLAASCIAALYKTNYFSTTKGLIRGLMMELTYEYLDKEQEVHTYHLTSKKTWLELMKKQVYGYLTDKEYYNVIQFS